MKPADYSRIALAAVVVGVEGESEIKQQVFYIFSPPHLTARSIGFIRMLVRSVLHSFHSYS